MAGETRCRVCGLPQGQAIWDEDGQTPCFDTCACCGCTFGRDDTSPAMIRAYRVEWRATGAKWFDAAQRPAEWQLKDQLARLPRFTFRVLPGLRGAGPGPVPFRFAGRDPFEGFIVEFVGIGGGEWVGNFQRAIGAKDAVLFAPLRTDHVIVVAGGMGYVVELESRTLVRTFGGAVNDLFYLPGREAVIFGNGLWFECEGADGLLWKTPRLAWDGMKDVRLEGSQIHGSAFDGAAAEWCPFTVDLESGALEGGAKPP